MKKIALCTLLSLSCTLFAGDVVQYEVSPYIGYNSFDSGSKMQNKVMYGIRGTVFTNEFYGYQLGYERADNVHYDSATNEKYTDLQRISAQLIINGEEEYNIIPYILFGGGYEMLSDETDHDVSQAFIDAGLGFKYLMTKSVNLNLEGRVLKKFDTDDIDYALTFGAAYVFGPTIKKAKSYRPSVLD